MLASDPWCVTIDGMFSWNGVCRTGKNTLPLTSSDWRSALNTRADVRRMIRQDGLAEAAAQKPLLEKALELPVPLVPESPDERMVRLENEVTGLIDLVFEQDEKLTNRPLIELTIDGNPMKIEPAQPAPTPIDPAAAQTETKIQKGKKGYLLSVMSQGEWIRLSDLVRRAGLPRSTVSATLNYWKKKGIVENKDRKWCKIG
jgi:hypothetical protein